MSDIFEEPEFVEIFSDVSAPEDSPIKFECIAEGKPAPKVIFLHSSEMNTRFDLNSIQFNSINKFYLFKIFYIL